MLNLSIHHLDSTFRFNIHLHNSKKKGCLRMKEKERFEDKRVLPLSQLRQMEVIDISEGKRLGFISDIIFDDDIKGIEYIVIPPQSSVFSIFRKKDEVFVKWDSIKIIGIDIILVSMDEKKANDVEFTNI
jgi:YlmC/YmxH family sporulation protein